MSRIKINNYHAMKKVAKYFDYEITEDKLAHDTMLIIEDESGVYMTFDMDSTGEVFEFRHADNISEAIEELLLWHD